MFHKWKRVVVVTGVVSVAMLSGEVALAQCSGGGGGGGRMPSGSPSTLNSNLGYASNPLIQSSASSLAMQYQQRALQAQSQAYALAYQNAQRQRLTLQQRNAELYETRLANAEAKRAARAERIAARLRGQGQSASDYMLTSTSISTSTSDVISNATSAE
ncbi:hypothetical protein [Rhodopirellula sp. SWK7]|uniref:hypothetical protein n=1 Tax=Rhodopirellula sp. SWK7 TaxID=595460 RepID=UPI0002BDCD9A|nr:hypothetical protein [Rhodopirellula sp. SWK7]EMI44294.1 secreted protein [Rhodopirellula sp. SWK7]